MNEPRFHIWFLFAVTTTLALSIALWAWLWRASYLDREEMMKWLAIVVSASPAVFVAIPRGWLDSPRALFFAWLPWPCGALIAGFSHMIDDGSALQFGAIFIVIASFFAIFTPTIIVGMRRERLPSKSPGRGDR